MKLSSLVDGLLVGVLVAAASLAYVEGAHVEVPRKMGLLRDPYKNMTAQESVQNVRTWEDARSYIRRHLRYASDRSNYGVEDYEAPFSILHQRGRDDCDGGAVAGAALLSDDKRYEVRRLLLEPRPFLRDLKESGSVPGGIGAGHAIALVRDNETGKYGSLGINEADNIEPQLDTPDAVFKAINRRFLLMFNKYSVDNYEESSLLDGHSPLTHPIEQDKPYAFFVEKPYKPGEFAFFEINTPTDIPDALKSPNRNTWTPSLDKAPSYSLQDMEAFSDRLMRETKDEFGIHYFYNDQSEWPRVCVR